MQEKKQNAKETKGKLHPNPFPLHNKRTINFKKMVKTFNLRYNLTTSITVTNLKATYSKLANLT